MYPAKHLDASFSVTHPADRTGEPAATGRRPGTVSPVGPVCLIRPPAVESFRVATTSVALPIGLAYIASALEASGRSVQVIDAVASAPRAKVRYFKGYLVGLTADQVVARIPAESRVVGIAVMFTNEWPAISELVARLAAARPDVTIVLGGEHVTAMPEFSLRTSRADVAVLGEGEETVVELLDALEAGGDLADVAGIAYRGEGEVVVNPRRRRNTAIDDIAPPAWHHFDVELYHDLGFIGAMQTSAKSMPILGTRGCPYQCTYCSAPSMWMPKWIPRAPAAVADEIESNMARYGATHFVFRDLTAIIRKDWIVEFCNELIRRDLDITWQLPTGTRSEAIDEEVAGLLARTGMTCMSYAPEAGSDETRKLIKKKLHMERMMKSIDAAVGAGLNVTCFLVVGFPHDDRASVSEHLELVDHLAAAGVSDAACAFYMALPGTELFDSLYDAGKIRIDRAYFQHILSALQLWATQTYCEKLSRPELTYWKLRVLLRFYRKKRVGGAPVGLGKTLRLILSGIFGKRAHVSKLQSVMHNAVVSAWHTFATRLRPGWISRREERRFFADWDDILRDIRRSNLAQGIAEPAPADTRELHKRSVVPQLKLAGDRRHSVADSPPAVALPAP